MGVYTKTSKTGRFGGWARWCQKKKKLKGKKKVYTLRGFNIKFEKTNKQTNKQTKQKQKLTKKKKHYLF